MLLSSKASLAYLAWLMTFVAPSSCQSNASTTDFAWPAYPEITYATSIPKLDSTPTYASPYSVLSTLLANQSTTTWPVIASPTDFENPYGNAAWTSQWSAYTNTTALPFSTTVSPTPIPSTELIKPPALPLPTEGADTEALKFPSDFLYGFAGAALQVEGAVQSEGRGPASMEITLMVREPTLENGGSPDIADLNYFLYKQDIARLAAVGVQTYSFSISWTRILPFGVPGSPVNQQGIDHYNDLIDTILEYGMTPMATLVHFDVPHYYATNTSIQGYDHPEFIEGFVNYAQIVLTHFGDRIGHWISINEPGTEKVLKNWASSHSILMAHAEVVHWYREVLNGTGKWSMKLSFTGGFPIPLDPSNPGDVAAAQRYLDFQIGYYTNPAFLGEQVPASVSDALGSAAPVYTDSELEYVNGTFDFLAVDLYTAAYATSGPDSVESCASNSSNSLWPYCMQYGFERNGWDMGAVGAGCYIFKQHLRSIMSRMDAIPNNPGGIMITEFGLSAQGEADMTVEVAQSDLLHSAYYLAYLEELLKSVNEDGVHLIGAIGWAFVDNWEWGEYNDRFGVQVFNHTTLERYYKRSIFDFVGYVQSHME